MYVAWALPVGLTCPIAVTAPAPFSLPSTSMKRTILFAAALCAFGTANAQVSVIPKAGLTLARQHFEERSHSMFTRKHNKNMTGFTAGVGFQVPVGKNNRFSFQPELLYVQKGSRLHYSGEYRTISMDDPMLNDDGSIEISTKTVVNYLEMPLLGRVGFGSEPFKFFVTAGPSVGYALNGRYLWKMSPYSIDGNAKGRILYKKEPENNNGDDAYRDPARYNRVDVGIQGGVGCGLAAGPGVLQFEARYGFGLTPEFKGGTDANRVLAFTLGYAIPLGGK